MRIVCPDDCGNAPRKVQLRDFIIACAQGALGPHAELLAEGVVWDVVGEKAIVGRAAVGAYLEAAPGARPEELRIHTIVTHGSTAALNATLLGPGESRLELAEVYHFTGAGSRGRIRAAKSYRIPVESAASTGGS